MAKTIRLDIVTPEKVAFADAIDMLIARTSGGDIGVLPGHAPLIAGLAIWPLRLLQGEGETEVALGGGFIEVLPDKITILAHSAEMSQDIDVSRAEAAKERAENRLKGGTEDFDRIRAELALQRAVLRLKLAKR